MPGPSGGKGGGGITYKEVAPPLTGQAHVGTSLNL